MQLAGHSQADFTWFDMREGRWHDATYAVALVCPCPVHADWACKLRVLA